MTLQQANLLVVGDNQASMQLLGEVITEHMPFAKVNRCGSLRVGSPEVSLNNLEALILVWENNPMKGWQQLLMRDTPYRRSCEAIVWKVANSCGERTLRRTAVLAKGLSQEEVLFLAEFNIRCVKTMGNDEVYKRSDLLNFVDKLKKHIKEEESYEASPANQAIHRFELALSRWSNLDDFQKMRICADIRRYFNNSATYDELMARKAIAEENFDNAEKFLKFSLEKNPNYIRAKQALADLHMSQGRISEALEVYLTMQQRNPRHPGRLAKIAECYLKLGKISDADKAYSDALSLDEHSCKIRQNNAITRITLGDYHGAKMLMDGVTETTEMAAYFNSLGIRLVKAGRFPEAIEHYKKAQLMMKTNESRHIIFLNTGLAYAKWGRIFEAKQYAYLALARDPKCSKALQLLEVLNAKSSVDCTPITSEQPTN